MAKPSTPWLRLDLDSDNTGTIIHSGNDFYSSPRLSPDGSRLAWLSWNHPNMPWDGTELWLGQLNGDGSVGERQCIAGGARNPSASRNGRPTACSTLISDRTGWWNLHRWRENQIEALCPMEAEFGQPQWVFGGSLYGFASERQIVCSYSKNGIDSSRHAGHGNQDIARYRTSLLRQFPKFALLAGASSSSAHRRRRRSAVIALDLSTRQFEVLRRSRDTAVDAGYLSEARAIEFPTEQGLTAHGYFYPPKNCDYAAPANEKPPLLVMSHGGPTSSSSAFA